MGSYEEKLQRVKAAIALEPVDKIPFLPITSSSTAAYLGVTLKDWIEDYALNCTASLKFCQDFETDGTQTPIYTPHTLPTLWLSNVQIPGENGPDNELWQVKEAELMHQEDYDKILEMGWTDWYNQYLMTNFGEKVFIELKRYLDYYPTALQRFAEAGIPSFCDGVLATPYEMICGGRSMEAFLMDDLFDIPDKVEEVFDMIQKARLAEHQAMFESPAKPNGVWIGLWRGTPDILSPEVFERFSWKYVKELVDLCVQYDVIPLMHLDACWDRGLKYFRELPAKKMLLSFDGSTDMYLAKEILGDHSCLMGDVPPQMSAFAKPQEVYDYCMRLIRDIGPVGFVLASGCDLPFNVNFDNIRMMAKAVADYKAMNQ